MSDSNHPAHTPNWEQLEASPEFRALLARKTKFIVTATIFFMVYYMALPVLVGYFPEFMSKEVIGKINIAYLFAFSQFIMTWVVCAIYVKAAKSWDRENEALLAKYL